ncbi:SAM-dependent methyltransferase [Nonomuraea sp. NPDC050310]|uniref:SAM-dependent methyltransferase n=1 Tax=Nonomuraea sp. NPDC050310 TaxID=3154935 RepID=UPI0033D9EFD9
MTEQEAAASAHTAHLAGATKESGASIARVYNAVVGGKDHRASERDLLDSLVEILPQLTAAARANVDFIHRAVAAVAELGVDQFLDLGCGMPSPTGDTVLQTARRFHPHARVVYVDNDEQVAVHGRALLAVPDQAIMVETDARDTDEVLKQAAELLDFSKPVGIIAAALAHFWPETVEPAQVLGRYTAVFPAGFVIFSHACGDRLSATALQKAIAAYQQAAPIYPRSAEQIAEFLTGYDVLEPGLVEASWWRPPADSGEDVGNAQFLAAVAAFGPYNEIPR